MLPVLIATIAFGLAFLSIWASMAVNGALVIYFTFTGQERRAARHKKEELAGHDQPSVEPAD